MQRITAAGRALLVGLRPQKVPGSSVRTPKGSGIAVFHATGGYRTAEIRLPKQKIQDHTNMVKEMTTMGGDVTFLRPLSR